MLIECSHCGAPLDVTPSQRVARCVYCRRDNEVLRTNRLDPSTPAGWRPPETWTDAQTGRVLKRGQGGRLALVLVAFVLVVTVGIGGAVAAIVAGTAGQTAATAVSGGAEIVTTGPIPGLDALKNLDALGVGGDVDGWDGSSPLSCAPNQRLVIEGKTIESTLETPLVRALGPNCEVTIRDSTLKAPRVLLGGPNARIEIVDSILEAEDVALSLSLGGNVTIRGRSRVAGRRIGIEGGTNLDLTVLGPAELLSDETAVDGQLNLRVTVRDGTVGGGRVGVRGQLNAHLELSGGAVRGGDRAIELGMNGTIRADDTEVTGQVTTGRNADVSGL